MVAVVLIGDVQVAVVGVEGPREASTVLRTRPVVGVLRQAQFTITTYCISHLIPLIA